MALELTQRRILAVDDDHASLRVLAAVLERSGCPVVTAGGGEEALQRAREMMPDLILLDITMPPGIDGFETIQRLKADAHLSGIPVIVLSSLGDTPEKVRALQGGAVDYVTKPFRWEEVLARVTTHLTIRSLQRDLSERNHQLENAARRMQFELEAAARLQRAMLPRALPDWPGYEFSWASRPCFEVGGDALDIFELNESTLGFYVLDVSGHGVAACMLAVSLSRSLTPRPDSSSLVTDPTPDPSRHRIVPPSEVVRRLNALNPMDADRNPHFVTIIYGFLDRPSGRVRFACAGHPPPIVIHADGSSAVVGEGSLPLGVRGDTAFEDYDCVLAPGDRFLLHSDGAVEQAGPQGEPFGGKRLLDALSGSRSIGGCIQSAVEQVIDWAKPGTPTDDLSLLGIQRRAA